MQKYLVILILSSSSFFSKTFATECGADTIDAGPISLYLCQNHSSYSVIRDYRYQVYAKLLALYVHATLKAEGESLKTFEIELYDPILSRPHLILKNKETGYFISHSGLAEFNHGFASFGQLKIMIDYFLQEKGDDLELFIPIASDEEEYDQLIESIHAFFKEQERDITS